MARRGVVDRPGRHLCIPRAVKEPLEIGDVNVDHTHHAVPGYVGAISGGRCADWVKYA